MRAGDQDPAGRALRRRTLRVAGEHRDVGHDDARLAQEPQLERELRTACERGEERTAAGTARGR